MRPITFHSHNTVRANFRKGRFARMRWIFTEFGKKCPEVLLAYRVCCDR